VLNADIGLGLALSLLSVRFINSRSSAYCCTQYDRLLASHCRLSVCLSVCNAVYCGSRCLCIWVESCTVYSF